MKLVADRDFRIFHNHRAEPYFTFVKKGQKTLEGRIKKGWYTQVAPGNHIVVYNEEETDSVEVLVKGVRTYTSLREMLEKENLKRILPDATSLDHGLKIYQRFYSPEEERLHGVVAIEITRTTP